MERFEGLVQRKEIAEGSKSERAAILLVTSKQEYILRRRGGNPFADPALEALVGKRVSCVGVVHGSTLLVSEWELVGQQRGK